MNRNNKLINKARKKPVKYIVYSDHTLKSQILNFRIQYLPVRRNQVWFSKNEKVKVLVFQSCPTLCNPMDYSPPGSSVHGILQAYWSQLSFPSPGVLRDPEGWNPCLPHCKQILYHLTHHNKNTAYQLLQVYQTIWQCLGKSWEMLGMELQLNPVRPINPKGEKILYNHCCQNTFHTHQQKKISQH